MPALPTCTNESCKRRALLARLLFILACAYRRDTLRVRFLKQLFMVFFDCSKKEQVFAREPRSQGRNDGCASRTREMPHVVPVADLLEFDVFPLSHSNTT